jgi:glycosyltransferase involved in cell wall biosynthesis
MYSVSISIVIPSFNQGPFIERTIDSVRKNRAHAEIIVMDGGSSDATVGILRRRQQDLAHWRSEADRGQADAINKALRLAHGDIIGWLNSDDVYLPGTIDRVLRIFGHHPEIDVVHGDRLMIDEHDGVIGWASAGPFAPHQWGYNINSETAFWRREKAAGLEFDASLRFAMDLEWFSRLYHRGLRFHYCPVFLGAFRCYASNKSSTIPQVGEEEARREWRRIFSNDCWRIDPPGNRVRHYSAAVSQPGRCLIPYLYRRLWLRRRGLLSQPA